MPLVRLIRALFAFLLASSVRPPVYLSRGPVGLSALHPPLSTPVRHVYIFKKLLVILLCSKVHGHFNFQFLSLLKVVLVNRDRQNTSEKLRSKPSSRSFIHLVKHSFMHGIHSFDHLFMHALIHSYIQSFMHSFMN